MDLSGRGSAYRAGVVLCAGCGEPMRAELTSSAQVDVCDACGGLWVDWFDGEIHTLAVETEAARVERGTPPPGLLPHTLETKGSHACPCCARPLVPELYRFKDARDDELVTGVELMRCVECAGSFVPRPSAHLLLDRVRDVRPASTWEAIVLLVRDLVRGLVGKR